MYSLGKILISSLSEKRATREKNGFMKTGGKGGVLSCDQGFFILSYFALLARHSSESSSCTYKWTLPSLEATQLTTKTNKPFLR